MIDLYCERTAPGLWGEPFNVLSNAAYLLVAWALVRRVRRAVPASDRQAHALALLPLAIAAGSALFHLFATRWARRLDEAPILAFELLFVWMYARRALRWPPVLAGLAVAAMAAAVAGGKLVQALNGSVSYMPPLMVGAAVGARAWLTSKRADVAAGAAIFAVAIACRVIDTSVCGAFPVGTHFIWHLLTAAALYLFAGAMVPR